MTKRLLVAIAATALGGALIQAPITSAGAAPTPLCFGEPATIVVPGTPSSATSVTGTDADDVIVTGAGRDRVDGRGGDDLICTRAGNDAIFGQRGDDRMRGGRGVDRLSGLRGLDRADGAEGSRDTCAAERERRCERNFDI